MLLPPPRGKLDLTFSFVWIIVFSNIITVAICLLFLNQLAKITLVRASLIMPFILLLTYLGAFAEKNAFQDLLIVLVFGLLGWIMVKLDWQRPPLLLGLVLGPLMENRLFLSTDNYGVAWLWRPGVLILFALTLFGIFYPVLKERWRRKKPESVVSAVSAFAAGATTAVSQEEKGAIRIWDTLFTFLLVAALTIGLWQSKDFGFRAGLFPWVIGYPVLAFAIVQLILEFLGKVQLSGLESGPALELPTTVVYRRTAGIIGWIVGFLVAIWLVGFSVAVPLITLMYLKASGERWPITITFTILSWVFFYSLFEYSLHIPFPDGQLFLWLE